MSLPRTCPNGHPVEDADTLCPACGTLPSPDALPLPTKPLLPVIPGYEVLEELEIGRAHV